MSLYQCLSRSAGAAGYETWPDIIISVGLGDWALQKSLLQTPYAASRPAIGGTGGGLSAVSPSEDAASIPGGFCILF